ncbi:MAG: QueT transporter family protein [Clostridia bacterium]|nr:QueT transporter family protein [Clostridia bacterium]
MNKKLLFITEAAMIAALYCVLTIMVQPIASGPIQFRVSEALMLLPALLPAAVPGLYVGCVLANVLLGFGWVDIVFGGLATLLAALVTRRLAARFGLRPSTGEHRSRQELLREPGLWLLPVPSVIFNALIVGFYLPILMPPESGAFATAVVVSMTQLAISEAAVVYLLGISFFVGVYPFFVRHAKARA